MDKNAIKKYAVWARRELIERVSQKALQYGITADGKADPNADSVNGRLLSDAEKRQRQDLIQKMNEKGYEQVMEEVAYTWFNRFAALRFMEVNGYLPSHVRVFTDDTGAFKPQILSEALHLDLDGLNMNRVYELKNANEEEELFKYLLTVQCNALNKILPGMFQRIEDLTELLLPDNLLREGSAIEQMISLIPEEDWTNQVQIIGWLYQYYNTEPKDKVFADLKKNIKISKENIPAATQLFTPDWIVRYMVENSLGRLWVEGHPNEELKAGWKYYLEEAEQEPEVQAKLAEIRKEYAHIKPEDIRCIDPCMGSGHILCYLFDVLMQIYEIYGYSTREAVHSIVENNLYGLDIDDRAAQLSYFAVMMKARQYDSRFFTRGVKPNVYAICESNHLDAHAIAYFCNGNVELAKAIAIIRKELYDAKEYGSILTVTRQDWNTLYTRFDEIFDDISMLRNIVLNELMPLVRVAEVLEQKYDIVVTNPPYMGISGMSAKLSEFVKKHYPDSKSDLFACFIDKGNHMVLKNGYNCMVTMQSWMFLSSFEKMRVNILQNKTITNLMHMENMVMRIAFGTAVSIFKNAIIHGYKGTYNHIRLVDIEDERPKEFPVSKNRFAQVSANNFSKIPGSPVAYWVSEKFIQNLKYPKLKSVARARSGAKTGKNELFLRDWWEVCFHNVKTNCKFYDECISSGLKWFPYNKGGDARNWYGNRELIIDFELGGKNIKEYSLKYDTSIDLNATDVYFKQGITWTALTSSKNTFRFSPHGCAFDSNKGPMVFSENKETLYYLLGYFISPIVRLYLQVFNPSLSLQNGDMDNLPIKINNIKKPNIVCMVKENISLSKADWDSFETSWDFQIHPLVSKALSRDHWGEDGAIELKEVYRLVKQDYEQRFQTLKANEEKLNRIFIDIYGLQDELTPEVEDKDVTVYRYVDEKEDIPESMGSSRYALTKRDMIVSFISYTVGCMLGRYSLDVDGLAYAGGEWDESKYRIFPADKDNIIPICDDEYFDDDIVYHFIQFVKVVFGERTLQENLRFIADALGGKSQSKEVIRSYFLNDFFKDHCKAYRKCPIYWLFDSGRKNGFKALIYMHRYQPDTIARIRTDYVHEQQSRYRTAIADLERRGESASTGERVKLSKALMKLRDQADELKNYEEKIHHLADQMISIDLNDGVRHNYEIFKDVLAKIK